MGVASTINPQESQPDAPALPLADDEAAPEGVVSGRRGQVEGRSRRKRRAPLSLRKVGKGSSADAAAIAAGVT